jgi:hypothetical protein
VPASRSRERRAERGAGMPVCEGGGYRARHSSTCLSVGAVTMLVLLMVAVAGCGAQGLAPNEAEQVSLEAQVFFLWPFPPIPLSQPTLLQIAFRSFLCFCL